MSELVSEVDIAVVDNGPRPDVALDTSLGALPCTCGSGLHADVCCGLDLAKLKPADPSAANQARLAALTEARAVADRDAAIRLSIEILTEQPTLLEALSSLFLIRRHEGNRTAARALIGRLTTLVPHESRFSTYRVDGLIEDKAWREAEASARKVVRLMPADGRAHDTLGLVLSLQQKLLEGEFHLRRALDLGETRAPRLLIHLASNLQTQGEIDEARTLLKEAHGLNPNSLEAQLALAGLERIAGNFDEAERWLAQIEDNASALLGVQRLRAHLAYDRGDFARALGILEDTFTDAAQQQSSDAYLFGQTLDKLGRYDEAFAQFEVANDIQLNVAGEHFDMKGPKGAVQAARNFMSERNLSLLPKATVVPGAAQPLFIVGFGRSGTTMLEQSLSMHPRILAGGELPGMQQVAAATARLLGSPLAYPFALSELWMGDQHDQIGLLRDHYLNAAQRTLRKDTKHAQTPAWFTDKALIQERYLGLVHLLFPQSPIIHLVRHPLDVVVSSFANALAHGGYRNGVAEVAEYYLLVLESAEYFQSVIPTLRCMQVRYEDILEDQAHWTRAILDFVGESFDPACLDFHENKRHGRTLSHQQVREKIHSKSRFRYRHYLQHLGPAIEVLAPAIERLGYSI
jgi:tetratricopeptide (TPR) repeat protein